MQVTAYAKLMEGRRRGGSPSTEMVELSCPADGLSTILLLGDEPEMIDFLRRVADLYGYEVTLRDPGPCCDYGEFYESEGILAPIHTCPKSAPSIEEQAEIDAFNLRRLTEEDKKA